MCIQRNLRHACLALLGVDDDNAVGCAATVDGCRGGILENLDVVDIVRRQIVDVSYRYTVNHIERTVAAVERCRSAYTDGWRRPWLAIGLTNMQTGSLSLHALQGVDDGTCLKVFRRYRRNSRCNILSLDGTVANGHHFVKRIGVFLHGNFHAIDGLQRHCLETNVGKSEPRSVLHIERKLPIHIGCCTFVCSFYLHRSSNNRLILRVYNGSGHLRLLGKGCCRKEQRHHGQQERPDGN